MSLLSLGLLCLQACSVLSVLLPHANQPRSTEEIRQLAHQAATAAPTYSNDWAVQVEGGLEAANTIANTHGFINMGQVKPATILLAS